jgi:hypothetical protein
MARDAFGASTVAGFWRHWNPVVQQFLSTFVYAPLRRFLPRTLAVLLTFALCGAAHDVIILLPLSLVGSLDFFPVVTVAFLFIAAAVVITEGLRVSFPQWSFTRRAATHAAVLLMAFALSIGLSMLV